MSRKRSILDGVLYFINILFALGLLMAYLAYYLPPTLFSLFSYAATGFPILATVNLLFVIYWAIRLKRKILLPLFCLAIGYLHLPRAYQFGKAKREVQAGESLKVMSFNVRMFNAYQWLDTEEVPQEIIEVILREDPDVLMLQEYYEETDVPVEKLNYPYQHNRANKFGKKAGLIIFSKFPITGSQTIAMETEKGNKSSFHFADIEWKDQTMRFINVHLASVGLEDAEYSVLENPDDQNQENVQDGVKSIIKRLHYSYQRRAGQIKTVKETIRDSPHPIVLAGDFNDVPQSYVYHQVDQLLEDSFMNGGENFGSTYIRSPLPLRIDFIFHSESINSFNFRVLDEELSDHRPVVTELEYNLPAQ